MTTHPESRFTHGPLGPVYIRTALPIILVMSLNGMLSLADALFLGHFVGADALSAVTLIFPIHMGVIALSTLTSSGMSSLIARQLGARDFEGANTTFASAHALALTLCLSLIVVFVIAGAPFVRFAAHGADELGEMALTYLRIMILGSPLMFMLSLHGDGLRNEGRVALMAGLSVLVSLANIGFNWILISALKLGVAGSAYGTLLAQALAFALVIFYRLRAGSVLKLPTTLSADWRDHWGRILALGAPQSLNFIGLALNSMAIMLALQWSQTPHYAASVAAYGVITRITTFLYLPLLGLSQAMQTITGHNYGAGFYERSRASLRTALLSALVFSTLAQGVLTLFAEPIGALFVSDRAVIQEVARILPVMIALFCLNGPLVMVGMHYQAIGKAGYAALLLLIKPYALALPLVFLLMALMGEIGIWWSGPASNAGLLLITLYVLWKTAPPGFDVKHWITMKGGR
ncbi:MATE family efflux transporter [Woodsholea maritima]|uniref:MATE family efflux transporter n=1 Tax=Woodsholea maritima TaxID=240237 RepID=UPI00037B3694|nr:MATE family efflux transporter [Woodsholea maritima]